MIIEFGKTFQFGTTSPRIMVKEGPAKNEQENDPRRICILNNLKF